MKINCLIKDFKIILKILKNFIIKRIFKIKKYNKFFYYLIFENLNYCFLIKLK